MTAFGFVFFAGERQRLGRFAERPLRPNRKYRSWAVSCQSAFGNLWAIVAIRCRTQVRLLRAHRWLETTVPC